MYSPANPNSIGLYCIQLHSPLCILAFGTELPFLRDNRNSVPTVDWYDEDDNTVVITGERQEVVSPFVEQIRAPDEPDCVPTETSS